MRNRISYLSAVALAALFGANAQAANIEWNGFGSAYFGETLTSEVRNQSLRKARPEFGRLSTFGLNLGSNLTDDFSVAAQFIASGQGFAGYPDDDWDIKANWAFATWRPITALQVRFGRQLMPNFLAAEYANVGYLQPYRGIPRTLKLISGQDNFDGILLNYTFSTPVGSLDISGWTGASDQTIDLGGISADLELQRTVGGAVTLAGNGFKVRAMVNQMDLDTVVAMGATEMRKPSKPTQMTVGGSYDKNNVVVWAEYTQMSNDDGPTDDGTATVTTGNKFLEKASAYYVLAGYRIGNFMPRFTYASADYSEIGSVELAGKEQVYTAGINYQLNSNATFKLDYEYGKIPAASETIAKNNIAANGVSVRRYSGTEDTSQAIFAGIDFIF